MSKGNKGFGSLASLVKEESRESTPQEQLAEFMSNVEVPVELPATELPVEPTTEPAAEPTPTPAIEAPAEASKTQKQSALESKFRTMTNDGKEVVYLQLGKTSLNGEQLRIYVSAYQGGQPKLNIRQFWTQTEEDAKGNRVSVQDANGNNVLLPSKKGVSIPMVQVAELLEAIKLLTSK